MWVLEISKNGRELMRAPVEQASVLVGRSPACDVVLRYPGIRPVHFLIEWIGEGAPQPGEMDWSILDVYAEANTERISVDATETSEMGSGMGQLLSRERMTVSDFEFRWLFDPLAETHLQKGVLSARLKLARDGEDDSGFTFHSESQVLEIVTVDSERDRVTDIQHVRLLNFKQGYQPLAELPQVLLHTPLESRAQFSLERVPEARAFLRGFPIRPDDLKETVLGPNDLLQIRWNLHDYYLRLVPEVKSPNTPQLLWKDPFYLWCAGSLLALAIIIFFVSRIPIEPDMKEVIPPRIAQVTVRETRPPTPVAVEQPAVPEPPPESIPEKVEDVPTVAQPVAPKAEVVTVKPRKVPPKPSIPAKKEPVTKMGLLANLKNPNKAPQVKADKILNQGIVSDTVRGSGGFVVKQPPAGTLGKRDRDNNELDAAASKVTASNKGDTNTLGTLRGSDSGSLNSVRYGNRNNRQNSGNEVITGGLDREAVLRTLRTYNKEVRSCYEKALLVRPKLKGRMTLRWTITATGQTSALSVVSSRLKMPSLEKCVAETIQSVQWPRAGNGQATIVNYPFEFQSQN